MNKLISIKLSARSIVACYDLKMRFRPNWTGDTIEQTTKIALELLLEVARRQKLIPDLVEEHAEVKLRELGLKSELPSVPQVKLASEEEVRGITKSLSETVAEVVAKVSAEISKPSLEPSAPDNLPEGIDQIEDRISFEDIQKSCPKDALVEYAVEQKLTVMQEAISIVYSQIPPGDWGTGKTKKLVEQVIVHLVKVKNNS